MGTRTQSTCKDTNFIPKNLVISTKRSAWRNLLFRQVREAIYYRIHKLAYGASWKYDYETFVSWDAKNR